MCTVVILNRAHQDCPVVLAANRDELYTRPSAGPRLWPGEPTFVAPVDLDKGGTWLAISSRGFVVAVTNQRTLAPAEQAPRSRGELVVGVARAGSRSQARRYLASIDARDFNPFNLLFGDASGLELAYGRTTAASVELARVPEGVHVLPNDRLDSPDVPKVWRIRAQLSKVDQLPKSAIRPLLQDVLRSRELPALGVIANPPPASRLSVETLRELDAVAVSTPLYGTRSSSIITLEAGRASSLWWADGPPPHTPFEDQSALLGLLP